MDRVKIVVVDWLPVSVYGLTKEIFDGEPFFYIFVNAKVSYEKQKQTVKHELLHIFSGDLSARVDVNMLENHRHSENGEIKDYLSAV